MMKVYILSEGSYSDWNIIGIYDNKELAEEEKAIRAYKDINDIEEYELNPPLTKKERNYKKGDIYTCFIDIKSGEIKDDLYSMKNIYRHPKKCIIEERGDWSNKERTKLEIVSLRITSPVSMEHAHKVAIETRQQYLREHTE